MSDTLETIQATEGLVIVGLVAFGIYLLYSKVYCPYISSDGCGSPQTPGTTLGNAATGQLSPGQINDLIAQETASLIQAGATPANAKAQATQDVNQNSKSESWWDTVTGFFNGVGQGPV